jgi:NTP pyrophosphatase (non-canonical NTP hydrolase)
MRIMSMRDWWLQAVANHEQYLALARARGRLKTREEVVSFLALALCSEAGELGNLLAKVWQGQDVPTEQIAGEMADVRVYLELLSRYLGIDLDDACAAKAKEVQERLASGGDAASRR